MAPRTSSRMGQPSLLLQVHDRLRKRFEYRRLRKQGRRVHTRSFVLQVAASESERSRLGITISRQVGNAVRRNRLKRLVREAFRQHRSLFPAAADVVVIAKNGCSADALDDVVREFEQASGALRAAYQRSRAEAHAPTRRTARSGPAGAPQ